ncbi:MAG: hypothetical protein OXU51_11380 [Candidatus Poribacteria bacterium]|nr:hypothetical protein [Candidatus Poribacteria bacterium]
MTDQKNIPKDEEIYRRIPAELEGVAYIREKGRCKILPGAFRDRYRKVSVDRAKLNNFDYSKTQSNPEDGIVKLKTENVCKIGDVVTKHEGDIICCHSVKVVASPDYKSVPPNPAHALIIL